MNIVTIQTPTELLPVKRALLRALDTTYPPHTTPPDVTRLGGFLAQWAMKQDMKTRHGFLLFSEVITIGEEWLEGRRGVGS